MIKKNCIKPISLEKDILQKLTDKGLAFVFQLDHQKHFWKQLKNASDAIECSNVYLSHKATKNAAGEEEKESKEQKEGKVGPKLIGNVYIAPLAKVHPSAVIGPNVTIAAGATIGEGARVKESMILEDAEIHAHSTVI